MFMTVIVFATCSAQSWFFLQQRAALATKALLDNGALLANQLAVGNRHSILVNDAAHIHEQIAGSLAIEHVAYAVVRSADGQILAADGKGHWAQLLADTHTLELLSLPPHLATASKLSRDPVVRPLRIENGVLRLLESPPSWLGRVADQWLTPWNPPTGYYDIAVPVLQLSPAYDNDPALSLTLRETDAPFALGQLPSSAKQGTLHIGLSDGPMLQQLQLLVFQVFVITGATILVGLVGVLFLARRISDPITALTSAAARIAEGDLTVRANSTSSNEIGSLTRVFNNMVAEIERHELDMQQLNQTLENRVQARTEELQQANHRLQELDRLKTQLVATASHELRTPLTSMTVYLSNLLNGIGGPVTPNQAETLRNISENTGRLRRLIDELLDLSHLQGNRTSLQPEPVQLDKILQNVVDALRHLSARKNLAVHLNFPPSLAPVWGNTDKLRRVFANLLHNAIKYTPSGRDIRLTAEPAPGDIVSVCIEDSGCGIPSHELEKVFLPFYRSASGTTASGSGLGLAIAKELVQLHGGTIRIESTVGKGSRFFVALPTVAGW